MRRSVGRWAFPLTALLSVAALLVAFRAWTDHQMSAPIAQNYSEFLDVLANRSEQARAYRASYKHHFARDKVASRHFEQVCATMLRMAQSDGAEIAEKDAAMAEGCRQHQSKYGGDALPRD